MGCTCTGCEEFGSKDSTVSCFSPQRRSALQTKAKAKPEILKHGGNGGKTSEETEKALRGCSADRKASPSATVLSRKKYLLRIPPFPQIFLLRSLRVSSFLVLIFYRRVQKIPGVQGIPTCPKWRGAPLTSLFSERR